MVATATTGLPGPLLVDLGLTDWGTGTGFFAGTTTFFCVTLGTFTGDFAGEVLRAGCDLLAAPDLRAPWAGVAFRALDTGFLPAIARS